LRAVEVLQEADLVIAENRERALALLNHLQIRKPIVTINAYNESRKARGIAQQVLHGSDAPSFQRPAPPVFLTRETASSRVPGDGCGGQGRARAFSGDCGAFHFRALPDRFTFYGFLPQKRGKRKKILADVLAQPFPVVFFESPRRLEETLRDISESLTRERLCLSKK